MTKTSDDQPNNTAAPKRESTLQQRLRAAERLAEQLQATTPPPIDPPATAHPSPPALHATSTSPGGGSSTELVPSVRLTRGRLDPDAGWEYTITVDDIGAYNLFCARSVPAVRRRMRRAGFFWLSLAGLSFLTAYFLPVGLIVRLALFWVGSTTLVLALLQFFFVTFLVTKQVARAVRRGAYKQTLGKQHLFVDAEAYVIAKDGLKIRRLWAAVTDVVEDDSYLYLFVEPTCANIIPRRVCTTEQQWADLLQRIKEYHRAATTGRNPQA